MNQNVRITTEVRERGRKFNLYWCKLECGDLFLQEWGVIPAAFVPEFIRAMQDLGVYAIRIDHFTQVIVDSGHCELLLIHEGQYAFAPHHYTFDWHMEAQGEDVYRVAPEWDKFVDWLAPVIDDVPLLPLKDE